MARSSASHKSQPALVREVASAAGEQGPRSPPAPVQNYFLKHGVKELERRRRSKMRARKSKERPALPPWDLDISIRSYEGVGPWFGSPTSKQHELDIPQVSISNLHLQQHTHVKEEACVHMPSSTVEATKQRIAVDKRQAKERIVRKASWKKPDLVEPKKPRKSLAALGLVARPKQTQALAIPGTRHLASPVQTAADRRPTDRGKLVKSMVRATSTAPAAFKSSTTTAPEGGNARSPPENGEDTGCLPLIKTLAQQLIDRLDAACTSNSADGGEAEPLEDMPGGMLHCTALMPPDSPASCSRMLQNSQVRQDLSADSMLRCRVPGICFPKRTDLSQLEQAGTTLATSPSAASEQQASSLLQRKPGMKEESNQACEGGGEPSSNRFSQTYSDIFVIRLPCVREGASHLCLSYLGKLEGAALTAEAGLEVHQGTEEAEESDSVLGKASKLSQVNADVYQIKLPNLQRVLRGKDEDAIGRPTMKEWTTGSKRDPLSVINIYTRQRQTEARAEEPAANSMEQALVLMPPQNSSYKLPDNNAREEFQSSRDGSTGGYGYAATCCCATSCEGSQLAHHRTRCQKRHTTPTWNKLSVEIRKLKRIRKEWKHEILSAQLDTDGWMAACSPVGHSRCSLRNTFCEATADSNVTMHHPRKQLSSRRETKMDWLERNVLEKRKEAEELRVKWKRHLLELELQVDPCTWLCRALSILP